MVIVSRRCVRDHRADAGVLPLPVPAPHEEALLASHRAPRFPSLQPTAGAEEGERGVEGYQG